MTYKQQLQKIKKVVDNTLNIVYNKYVLESTTD